MCNCLREMDLEVITSAKWFEQPGASQGGG